MVMMRKQIVCFPRKCSELKSRWWVTRNVGTRQSSVTSEKVATVPPIIQHNPRTHNEINPKSYSWIRINAIQHAHYKKEHTIQVSFQYPKSPNNNSSNCASKKKKGSRRICKEWLIMMDSMLAVPWLIEPKTVHIYMVHRWGPFSLGWFYEEAKLAIWGYKKTRFLKSTNTLFTESGCLNFSIQKKLSMTFLTFKKRSTLKCTLQFWNNLLTAIYTIEDTQGSWFMQDGVRSHSTSSDFAFPEEYFGNKLIVSDVCWNRHGLVSILTRYPLRRHLCEALLYIFFPE